LFDESLSNAVQIVIEESVPAAVFNLLIVYLLTTAIHETRLCDACGYLTLLFTPLPPPHSKGYLLQLFAELGYVADEEATARMTSPPNRKGLKHDWWWFRMGTIQVLRRKEPRTDCK